MPKAKTKAKAEGEAEKVSGANRTLLDNIRKLNNEYDRDYLVKRVKDWKEDYKAVRDEHGCLISATRASNGYACITLRSPQWHVRAYTLIAFVENKLPSEEELANTKHPISSHTCGRGKQGCFEPSHIIFGEPQSMNMKRLHGMCNIAVECGTCHTLQIARKCTGHDAAAPCTPPRLTRKPPERRLKEIDEAIEALKAERKTIVQQQLVNDTN